MKQLLWDLFKKTGKIEYYMLYKKEVNNEKKNSSRKTL